MPACVKLACPVAQCGLRSDLERSDIDDVLNEVRASFYCSILSLPGSPRLPPLLAPLSQSTRWKCSGLFAGSAATLSRDIFFPHLLPIATSRMPRFVCAIPTCFATPINARINTGSPAARCAFSHSYTRVFCVHQQIQVGDGRRVVQDNYTKNDSSFTRSPEIQDSLAIVKTKHKQVSTKLQLVSVTVLYITVSSGR